MLLRHAWSVDVLLILLNLLIDLVLGAARASIYLLLAPTYSTFMMSMLLAYMYMRACVYYAIKHTFSGVYAFAKISKHTQPSA